jgi:hypothetical protein
MENNIKEYLEPQLAFCVRLSEVINKAPKELYFIIWEHCKEHLMNPEEPEEFEFGLLDLFGFSD